MSKPTAGGPAYLLRGVAPLGGQRKTRSGAAVTFPQAAANSDAVSAAGSAFARLATSSAGSSEIAHQRRRTTAPVGFTTGKLKSPMPTSEFKRSGNSNRSPTNLGCCHSKRTRPVVSGFTVCELAGDVDSACESVQRGSIDNSRSRSGRPAATI